MTIDYFGSNNGQNPLLSVDKVKNGWIVTIHHPYRDKEISSETKLKREHEAGEVKQKRLDAEKSRLKKELLGQITSMAILGEAVGKAQAMGIDKHTDSWKYDEENISDEDTSEDQISEDLNFAPEQLVKNLDKYVEQILTTKESKSFLDLDGCLFPKVQQGTETYIFHDRKEMIKFVSEMLEPIIE